MYNLLMCIHQGIGRALASALWQYGATVHAISRTKEDLESLLGECPGIKTIQVDLSNWDETRKAVEACGPVDSVLNVAGVGLEEPFLEITSKVFDE
jgi:L-xylulose reductase